MVYFIAHAGHVSHELSLPAILRWWTPDPWVIAVCLVSFALYFRGLGVMRREAEGAKPFTWAAAAFVAGWFTVALALLSPLDRLSDILFSAHMAQHEILMLISAPLLVFARPLVPMLRGLPASLRSSAIGAMHAPAAKHAWHAITGPVFVLVAHGVALWIWHVPFLYEAALRNDGIHAVQHLMFFVTAALFWWAIVQGRYGRVGYGMAVLFVFATAMHTSILGVLLSFGTRLWYPMYGPRSAAWNIDPIEDQQLAGFIMWIPAGVIFTICGIALFAAWLGESERRVKIAERERSSAAVLLLALCVALPFFAEGCKARERYETAAKVTGGDPHNGKEQIQRYGCGSCHTIPGVPGANASVGPPLDKLGSRTYLAGELTNTPQNLVRWIQHPQQVEPKTAMPDLGVKDQDAKDIAAYLYTLR